ncbi:MAG: hypothetical protein WAO19_12735 [Candidatus Kryptoniota bacterium]
MLNLFLLFIALQSPLRHISGINATVYYSASMNTSIAKSYLPVIDQMCLDDTARFKIGFEDGLKVRLCQDAYEFSNLTGMDSIFSPLWKDGTLYIAGQGDLDDSSYRSILEAGVIRALLNRLHQNGAPWWLVNAAAAYESGEYKNCFSPSIENVDYFSDLDEKIQTASSPAELNDLCFYLGATGKFFELNFGAGSFLELVREFQRETNINEAVKALFHVERGQLESDWHNFIAKEAETK